MKMWKKIIGIDGLYLHLNGKYYIRRNYPKRSYHSLRTEDFKEAKNRIKRFVDSHYGRSRGWDNKTITFGDVAEKFINKELGQLKIKPKTSKTILHSIKHLKGMRDIWTKPMIDIRCKVLRKKIDYLPKLSNASKNYIAYSANKVIEYASDLEILDEAYNGKVKSFTVKPRKIDLPDDEQFKNLIEVLKNQRNKRRPVIKLPKDWNMKTKEELMKVMNASLATVKRRISEEKTEPKSTSPCPEVAFTFLFLCYTGMRLGEARRVQWKDVKSDHIIIKGTKSKTSHRILPLWSELNRLVEAIKKYRNTKESGEYIIKRRRIDKALKIACDASHIQYLRHHDLRHYFATKAIQSGVDIPTVSQWLGHSDGGALAMKVYTNLMDGHVITQAKKLTFGSEVNLLVS
jgi:integrase